MSKKPTVLMILDGYGLNDKCEANAVCEGKTPVMDQLMSQCPFVKGNASGMAVGLRKDRWVTQKLEHLNMGAGRIVYQELTRITKEIQDGDFFKNEALLAAVKNAKREQTLRCILWDCYLTVVYTATSLIFLVCWNWQKEKVWKKYMYTASWMVVTLRRHPEKVM